MTSSNNNLESVSLVDKKTAMLLTVGGNVLQIPSSTLLMNLWPSSPCFFALSPLQNIVTRLSLPSSSSFVFTLPFFSLLRPFLLNLQVAFVLSGCENLPWTIMARQREGTWMGSPAARPANQAGSLSVPVESSSSSPPLPFCSEHTTQDI